MTEVPEHLLRRAQHAREAVAKAQALVTELRDVATNIKARGGIIESDEPITDPELHAAYEAGHYKLPPDLMVANAHRVIEKRPERWRQVGWRHKNTEVLSRGNLTGSESENWEPVYACVEPPPKPPRVFKVTMSEDLDSLTAAELEDLIGKCRVEEVTHESH